MNKKTLIALFLLSFSFLARAETDVCDDPYGYNAYCSYIKGPKNTNKFLKIIDDYYATTFCANTTIGAIDILKDQIEDGSRAPGKHSFYFAQCDTILCDNEVLLATDTVTVLPNKTVDHSRFGFSLNPVFGENCNLWTHEHGDIDVIPEAKCGQFPYCAKITNPPAIKKWVKTVQDNGISFTVCVNSKTAYRYQNYFNPTIVVSNTVRFFQCDTLACKNQKLLGKDTFIFSPDGKVDHNQFSFTLDPTFGTSCEPVI